MKDPVSKEVASVPEDATRGCPPASTCTHAQMCVQTNVQRGWGESKERREEGERGRQMLFLLRNLRFKVVKQFTRGQSEW